MRDLGFLGKLPKNKMLRKNVHADAVSARLKRGKTAGSVDHSRGSALTAKNINPNYKGPTVSAIPDMVRLDPAGGSIPDQLNVLLGEHSVKLIDLFREWDADGNGAIDKKEFRQAVAALGYDVPKKDVNAAFDMLDDTGDGFIEYGRVAFWPLKACIIFFQGLSELLSLV